MSVRNSRLNQVVKKMTNMAKSSGNTSVRPLIWVIYIVVVTIVVAAVLEGAVRLLRIAPPLLAEHTAYVDDPRI